MLEWDLFCAVCTSCFIPSTTLCLGHFLKFLQHLAALWWKPNGGRGSCSRVEGFNAQSQSRGSEVSLLTLAEGQSVCYVGLCRLWPLWSHMNLHPVCLPCWFFLHISPPCQVSLWCVFYSTVFSSIHRFKWNSTSLYDTHIVWAHTVSRLHCVHREFGPPSLLLCFTSALKLPHTHTPSHDLSCPVWVWEWAAAAHWLILTNQRSESERKLEYYIALCVAGEFHRQARCPLKEAGPL